MRNNTFIIHITAIISLKYGTYNKYHLRFTTLITSYYPIYYYRVSANNLRHELEKENAGTCTEILQ